MPRCVDVSVKYNDAAGRLLRINCEHSASDRWSVVAVCAPAMAADCNSFLARAYDALDSGQASCPEQAGCRKRFQLCHLCFGCAAFAGAVGST